LLTKVAAGAGVALATAILAGSLTFPQVAFDPASRAARFFLTRGNPDILPATAPESVRFGPNARLSLPFVTSGGDLRVSLRLLARVRGDLDLVACGRLLGSARAPAGEPARLVIEGPAGNRCALDLGIALRPDPLDPTREVDASYELERLGVRATAGLRLAPLYAALVGCVPAALAFAIGMARIGHARPLLAALLAGASALAWAAFDPVSAAAGAPWVAGVSLLTGLGARLRARAARIARQALERADTLSDVAAAPRAPWYVVAALALVPALVTCLSLWLLLHRGILDHVPALNDATSYWLESAAFQKAGWNGGYFTVAEYTAQWSFTRFGMHGPGFPVAYGLLATVFGWQPWSAPAFNLALVTLAILAYAVEARLSSKACALAAAALASFWPFALFLPTNTQEGLHFPGALVLAALIRPAFLAPLGRARSAAVVTLMLGLSLVKPIWALLWPPLLVLLVAHRSRRARFLAFGAGAFLLIASVLVYGWLMAPYRDQAVSFVRVFYLSDGPRVLARTLQRNLQLAVGAGTGLELFQRAATLLLAAAVGGIALARRPADERGEALFHAWNLGVPLLATLVVYAFGPWNDYRILAVHFLLSSLLLLTSSRRVFRRLAVAVTAAQLATLPFFVSAHPGVVRPNYVVAHEPIEAFAAAVAPVLKFRPELSGWCNTLISTRFPYLYPEMVGLPKGFGVTMIWAPERGAAQRRTFRSAYVLIDSTSQHPYWRGGLSMTPEADGSRRAAFGNWAAFRLQPIAETRIGTLYRNLDSTCPE